MIEIALCLAIIGFALVAIIGVLPTGLNVQKENREETIINQDAVIWMDAIRNGAQGYSDLTNYVIAITNYWTTYTEKTSSTNIENSGTDWYDRNDSNVDPSMALTNGVHIIGLLSMPNRTVPLPSSRNGTVQSNYVVAWVRAMSGSVVEKYPQTDPTILGGAFSYRMIPEIAAYLPFDPESINTNIPAAVYSANPAYWKTVIAQRANYLQTVNVLQTNSHDLRLTFRWPLLPSGDAGNGRQSFRALVGGRLRLTNNVVGSVVYTNLPLYFFEPSTYVQAR